MRAYAQKPPPDTAALDFAIAGIVTGERVSTVLSLGQGLGRKRINGTCLAIYPRWALIDTDAGYKTTVSWWHLFGKQDEDRAAEKPKKKRKRRAGK